jgi:hypothetical protein
VASSLAIVVRSVKVGDQVVGARLVAAHAPGLGGDLAPDAHVAEAAEAAPGSHHRVRHHLAADLAVELRWDPVVGDRDRRRRSRPIDFERRPSQVVSWIVIGGAVLDVVPGDAVPVAEVPSRRRRPRLEGAMVTVATPSLRPALIFPVELRGIDDGADGPGLVVLGAQTQCHDGIRGCAITRRRLGRRRRGRRDCDGLCGRLGDPAHEHRQVARDERAAVRVLFAGPRVVQSDALPLLAAARPAVAVAGGPQDEAFQVGDGDGRRRHGHGERLDATLVAIVHGHRLDRRHDAGCGGGERASHARHEPLGDVTSGVGVRGMARDGAGSRIYRGGMEPTRICSTDSDSILWHLTRTRIQFLTYRLPVLSLPHFFDFFRLVSVASRRYEEGHVGFRRCGEWGWLQHVAAGQANTRAFSYPHP